MASRGEHGLAQRFQGLPVTDMMAANMQDIRGRDNKEAVLKIIQGLGVGPGFLDRTQAVKSRKDTRFLM